MQLKHLIITLAILVMTDSLVHATSQPKSEWLSTLPKPWQLEQSQLAEILPEFHIRYPDYKNRLRAIAEWRLGTPYKIFNLGEEQQPDPDPIFRLDVSDCTSHILTSMSLAESNNWQQAREHIIQMHYKPQASGETIPLYQTRWHYTSDRLMNHPMTPEVSQQYVPLESMASAEVTLNQKQDGTEFLDLGWSMPITVNYIPNDQITSELLGKLPDFVGVAFVKASYFKMGVVMAHEGMLLDGKYLLHAGQTANETVSEDFLSYYYTDNGPKFDGIMLYDFKSRQQQDAL